MELYFLTYDLWKERNNQPLYDELGKLKSVRILESTWCFRIANTSAKNLRDHFKSFIDSDDGFIVSQASDWASFNTDGTPIDLK